MQTFDQRPGDGSVQIVCLETNFTKSATVLQRSDKTLRVVVEGTKLPLTLSRRDLRRPYIGSCAGLEFACHE